MAPVHVISLSDGKYDSWLQITITAPRQAVNSGHLLPDPENGSGLCRNSQGSSGSSGSSGETRILPKGKGNVS